MIPRGSVCPMCVDNPCTCGYVARRASRGAEQAKGADAIEPTVQEIIDDLGRIGDGMAEHLFGGGNPLDEPVHNDIDSLRYAARLLGTLAAANAKWNRRASPSKAEGANTVNISDLCERCLCKYAARASTAEGVPERQCTCVDMCHKALRGFTLAANRYCRVEREHATRASPAEVTTVEADLLLEIDAVLKRWNWGGEYWLQMLRRCRASIAANASRLNMTKRDGNFLDELGCCKVCDGEIPDGHIDNCDIWKLEQRIYKLVPENASLRAKLDEWDAALHYLKVRVHPDTYENALDAARQSAQAASQPSNPET